MIHERHKILFEPVRIGRLELKNKIVMAPLGQLGLADADGAFTGRGQDYFVRRAKGGAGLLISGCCWHDGSADMVTLPSMPCPTKNPKQFIRTAWSMVERIHTYGCRMFIQIANAVPNRTSLPSILSSDVVYYGPSENPHRWLEGVRTAAMTREEIRRVVWGYGETAAVCKEAGFDGVEVHAVHEGYLLDEFAMAFYNRRTDEYGGSLENRLRFAAEIVQEIKRRCGQDFPVSVRYSVKSFIKGILSGGMPGEVFEEKGRDMEEGLAVAKILQDAGYDALNADVGSYESWYWSHPPMYHEKGMYLRYTKELKRAVSIPVITAGRMDDLDIAVDALEKGDTDLIGLARPLLADPDWPNKVLAGQTRRIRPCISCQLGCMGGIEKHGALACALRPQTAYEREREPVAALRAKNVAVIGGGVGGMEAARVCALRGHKVAIYEKGADTGGHVLAAGVPDFKEDDRALLEWYRNELRILHVPVYFHAEMDESKLLALNADAYIFATGSRAKMLPLPGAGQAKLISASDALLGKRPLGKTAVVIGGGTVGLETALWLQSKGCEVCVVEREDKLLALNRPESTPNAEMLIDLMPYKNIRVMLSVTALEASEEGLAIQTGGGAREVLPCDDIIVSVGFASDNALYRSLLGKVPEAYLIGDANRVGTVMSAVWQANEVALHL